MAEKNRRILQGTDVIYPFTRQENVIGLQKTITDKLPIVSATEPEEGFVPKQAWIDTGNSGSEVVNTAPLSSPSALTFGNGNNTNLVFGNGSAGSNNSGGLAFASSNNENLTFGNGNNNDLAFGS